MKAFAFYMKCRFGNHESEVMNNLMLSQWSVSVPGWWAQREQKQMLARFWWGKQWAGIPECQRWVGTGRGSAGRAVLLLQARKHRMEGWLLPEKLWCLFAQLWICSECTAEQHQQQFIPSGERSAGSQMDFGILSMNWITCPSQKVRTGMDAPSAGWGKLGINTWN